MMLKSAQGLLVAGLLVVTFAGVESTYSPQSILFSRLHNAFAQRSGGFPFGLSRFRFGEGGLDRFRGIGERGVFPRGFGEGFGRTELGRELGRELGGERGLEVGGEGGLEVGGEGGERREEGIREAEPLVVLPSPALRVREELGGEGEIEAVGEGVEREIVGGEGELVGEGEGGACEPSPKGYNCMMELAPFFKLHWTVGGGEVRGEGPLNGELPAPGAGEISFAMEGRTEGWVGMGFPEELRVMVPAGIVLGWIEEGGAVNVRPFSITERAITDADENRGVTLTNTGGYQMDGYTLVAYTIPIQSALTERALTDFPGVNFATGTEDALVFHGGETRGGEMLDLSLGA